nr:uncharacterized protein LOC114822956 [Malus domestica]
MRWHKERRVNDDVMRHLADGEAWKEFDRMYPDFAADPRNVRLGLATDGFNPFGVLNQNHSTWPVVVFPYNLPPWKCMKKEYMMLTLIMSEDLGKSIDVYLRPLVDKLKDLWENGVRTYDKYTGQMFTMRAAVIWLPWDNEWRQNDKAFHGTKETRLRPREWSGDEILDQLNHLEFGHLGKRLTAMCLRKSDVKQLQDDIVNVLCKFEQIFPPAFFTSMIHVMIHLPDEALLAGPVNCRLMYPIERYIGELKKCVRNRAKPEGSLVEAWVAYESLTFCAMYLEDVETAFNRPQRNNDGGVRKEKLSVFAQIARPFGEPVKGESFTKNDMEVTHWFILNNCEEALPYLEEHEQLMKREHPSHLYAKKHRDLFPSWFHAHMNKLKELNSPSYDEELYNLAR